MAQAVRPGADGEPAYWSTSLPGDRLFCWFEDDDVWHEHLLLWRFGDHAVVRTPDVDVYATVMWGDNQEGPVESRVLHRSGRLPWNLRAPTYRFAEAIELADLRELIREGRRIAQEEGARLGKAVADHQEFVDWSGTIHPIWGHRSRCAPGGSEDEER